MILVSNEVGLSRVAETPLGCIFDHVEFVAAGLPISLKNQPISEADRQLVRGVQIGARAKANNPSTSADRSTPSANALSALSTSRP